MKGDENLACAPLQSISLFTFILCLTVAFQQVEKGGLDDDEVKMVPQWKAKGIGPRPGGVTSRLSDDAGEGN